MYRHFFSFSFFFFFFKKKLISAHSSSFSLSFTQKWTDIPSSTFNENQSEKISIFPSNKISRCPSCGRSFITSQSLTGLTHSGFSECVFWDILEWTYIFWTVTPTNKWTGTMINWLLWPCKKWRPCPGALLECTSLLSFFIYSSISNVLEIKGWHLKPKASKILLLCLIEKQKQNKNEQLVRLADQRSRGWLVGFFLD